MSINKCVWRDSLISIIFENVLTIINEMIDKATYYSYLLQKLKMLDVSFLTIPHSEIDVDLLDHVIVQLQKDPSNITYLDAISSFQEREDSYICYIQVFSKDCCIQTKLLVLKILRNFVASHWDLISSEEKSQIHDFIIQFIHNDENLNNKPLLVLADEILVTILKFEWPSSFPSFISDIINEAMQNTILQENTLEIITQLANAISIDAENTLTVMRADQMNEQFVADFNIISRFVQSFFVNDTPPNLIIQCIQAIKSFVALVHVDNLLQIGIFGNLHNLYSYNFKMFIQASSIFAEICQSNNFPTEFNQQVPHIFSNICDALKNYSQDSNIIDLLSDFTDQIIFARTLTSLIAKYYKVIIPLDKESYLNFALDILTVMTMNFTDQSLQICVDFWAFMATNAYRERRCQLENTTDFFQPYFSPILNLIIEKIASPSDILQVEEDGAIGSQFAIQPGTLYDSMHEFLVYSTHLNPQSTAESIQHLLETETVTIDLVNRICWCMGAIGGVLDAADEQTLLGPILTSILDLLDTVEEEEIRTSIVAGVSFASSSLKNFFELEDNMNILEVICNHVLSTLPTVEPSMQIVLSSNFNKICRSSMQLLCNSPSGKDISIVESLAADLISLFQDVSPQAILICLDGVTFATKHCSEKLTIVNGISDFLFGLFAQSPAPTACIFLVRCFKVLAYNICDDFLDNFLRNNENILGVFNAFISEYMTDAIANDLVNEILDLFAVISAQISSKNQAIENLFEICSSVFLPLYSQNFMNPHILQIFAHLSLKMQQNMASRFNTFYTQLFIPAANVFEGENSEEYKISELSSLAMSLLFMMKCIVRTALSSLITMDDENFQLFTQTIDNLIVSDINGDVRDSALTVLQDMFTAIDSMPQNFSQQFFNNNGVRYALDIIRYLSIPDMRESLGHLSAILKRLLRQHCVIENISQLAIGVCRLFPCHDERQIEHFFLDLSKCVKPLEFKAMLRDFLVSVRICSRRDSALYKEEKREIDSIELQEKKDVPGLVEIEGDDITAQLHDLSQKMEDMTIDTSK